MTNMTPAEVVLVARDLIADLTEQLDKGTPANDAARVALAKELERTGGSLADLVDRFSWSAARGIRSPPPEYT